MKVRSIDGTKIALAAAAGLSLGAAACKGEGASSGPSQTTTVVAAAASSGKACCKGLNDCKSKGGCVVPGKNDCAGKNDCKGKGGCNMHCPK